MGISGGPYIVRDSSLVLELDAADKNSYAGSGTTWNDLVKSGNSGSLVSGSTFDLDGVGSILFDGTNDYVSLGTGYYISTASPFTINLWFNINKRVNDFQRIMTLDASGTGGMGIAYRDGTPSNGYDGLYVATSSGWIRGSTGQQLTSNIWRMLTYTYNGSGSTTTANFSMYLNASALTITTTGTETVPPAANNNLLGGRFTTADVQFYPGKIASSLIYNRVLSISEITQIYNEQKSRFGL